MTDLYVVASYTDKYCNIQKIVTDTTVFMAKNEITGQTIYTNFSQNLFNVIDKINNIMSQWYDKDAEVETLGDLSEKFENMGEDLSSLVRFMIGFNPRDFDKPTYV